MKGFLEETAEYLYRRYGEQLHRFCIVFPNIRAGLFFRKYLAELAHRPVWAPAFRSIHLLMEEITGWTMADRLTMVFALYRAFREHAPEKESFEEFYFWGEMLLDDFDDIDKNLTDANDNLIDAGELFRNIHDLKEIDMLFDYLSEAQKEVIRIFWREFNEGKAPLKEHFALIWSVLHPVYLSFKKRLREKSIAYEGMMQREAVRLIAEGNCQPYEKYVFIGFNVLSKCEKKFLKTLQKAEKALFFWDSDEYYIHREWHEAGAFLRENIRMFPQEWTFHTQHLTAGDKEITAISVPSETGQTQVAAQILRQLPETGKTDWSRVAVVLPDEHLLLPALSSIPPDETGDNPAKDINITMGYPFVYSPAHSLFERLASLQIHVAGGRFYHRDVNTLLHHPYVLGIAATEAATVVRQMTEQNRIYIPATELDAHPLFRKIFAIRKGARELTLWMMNIAAEIAANILKDENRKPTAEEQYQLEYLYTFYTSLQRMDNILSEKSNGRELQDMDTGVFVRLLRQIFSSVKIPFSGEPLKGLQMMGMLETRAIDFDTVIVLSMNEGIFPSRHHTPSFIPYHLRKGFGLTLSEQHDAASAYNFYRLIQRASRVFLIYSSASAEKNQGEMSRFLSQLRYEPAFNLVMRDYTFAIRPDKAKEIVVERTEQVREILQSYCSQEEGKTTLSPSALNCYLDCRMQFYFRYIERLKQKDEIKDEIDPSVFGLLLHRMMEKLYGGFIGKEIHEDHLQQILRDGECLNKAVRDAFAELFFHAGNISDRDITGRNIIIKEVLLKYVRRIIETDIIETPFKIIGLEQQIETGIPVTADGQTTTVNMGGYIDRLEETRNAALRIIDYKTGKANRNVPDIAKLFDRNQPDNHAAMQTFVYALMTGLKYPSFPTVTPALYVIRELFSENFDPVIRLSGDPVVNYHSISRDFRVELNSLLAEMFLSDEPFTQTADKKKCRYCLYAGFCHRD
ncbi:MAG: PD-(D/E)XK nuclease family protein [Bacteroidales bacterium]|jgi:hypothetical protein|nr:PD-(D/E)XK nuclease family protein [Bacteroidales bacterium]